MRNEGICDVISGFIVVGWSALNIGIIWLFTIYYNAGEKAAAWAVVINGLIFLAIAMRSSSLVNSLERKEDAEAKAKADKAETKAENK